MSGNIDYSSLYYRLEMWETINRLCKVAGYKSFSLSRLANRANISRQTLYCIINRDETGFGFVAAEKLEVALMQVIAEIINTQRV